MLTCKKVPMPPTMQAMGKLPNQYEFPVFEEREDELGNMVKVKVSSTYMIKNDLLDKKKEIEAMLIAIGVEEAKEVVEEQPVDAEIVEPKG